MTFREANKLAKEYLTICEDVNIKRFVEPFEAFNVGEGLEDICESCIHKQECSMPSYTNLGFYRCNFYKAVREVPQKEVMDAIRLIGAYCANTDCFKCPYSDDDDGYCMFEQVSPYLWEDRIKRVKK